MIVTIEELMRKLPRAQKRVSRDTEETAHKLGRRAGLQTTLHAQSDVASSWEAGKVSGVLTVQRPEYFFRSSPKRLNSLAVPPIRSAYV